MMHSIWTTENAAKEGCQGAKREFPMAFDGQTYAYVAEKDVPQNPLDTRGTDWEPQPTCEKAAASARKNTPKNWWTIGIPWSDLAVVAVPA